MKPIDYEADLGPQPPGLEETPGLCNYQWAIGGPRGLVIFYCTNPEPCDGRPHKVEFISRDDELMVRLVWSNASDIKQRLAASG